MKYQTIVFILGALEGKEWSIKEKEELKEKTRMTIDNIHSLDKSLQKFSNINNINNRNLEQFKKDMIQFYDNLEKNLFPVKEVHQNKKNGVSKAKPLFESTKKVSEESQGSKVDTNTSNSDKFGTPESDSKISNQNTTPVNNVQPVEESESVNENSSDTLVNDKSSQNQSPKKEFGINLAGVVEFVNRVLNNDLPLMYTTGS